MFISYSVLYICDELNNFSRPSRKNILELGAGNWFTYPKRKGDFFLKVYYYLLSALM